jgi:hypothetical protein
VGGEDVVEVAVEVLAGAVDGPADHGWKWHQGGAPTPDRGPGSSAADALLGGARTVLGPPV